MLLDVQLIRHVNLSTLGAGPFSVRRQPSQIDADKGPATANVRLCSVRRPEPYPRNNRPCCRSRAFSACAMCRPGLEATWNLPGVTLQRYEGALACANPVIYSRLEMAPTCDALVIGRDIR